MPDAPIRIESVTHPTGGPVVRLNQDATPDQAARLIFKDGAPPHGVSLVPSQASADGHTGWQIKGLTNETVTSLSGGLPWVVTTRTEVVPDNVWHAEREARFERDEKANGTVIPELGTTPRAIVSLGSGAYVIKDHFVWVGTKDGAPTIQWHPRSTETFNKDMTYYLERGMTLHGAIRTFDRQWIQISAQILGAFGQVLGAAAGRGVSAAPGSALGQGIEALDTAIELLDTVAGPDVQVAPLTIPTGPPTQTIREVGEAELDRRDGEAESSSTRSPEEARPRPLLRGSRTHRPRARATVRLKSRRPRRRPTPKRSRRRQARARASSEQVAYTEPEAGDDPIPSEDAADEAGDDGDGGGGGRSYEPLTWRDVQAYAEKIFGVSEETARAMADLVRERPSSGDREAGELAAQQQLVAEVGPAPDGTDASPAPDTGGIGEGPAGPATEAAEHESPRDGGASAEAPGTGPPQAGPATAESPSHRSRRCERSADLRPGGHLRAAAGSGPRRFDPFSAGST